MLIFVNGIHLHDFTYEDKCDNRKVIDFFSLIAIVTFGFGADVGGIKE